MEALKDNVIEWVNGQNIVTVTLSQGKHINKVKKLAEHNKEVEIVAENDDGSICAHLPLKYIKISAPKQMSEEQKEQARARLLSVRS